MHHPWRQEKSDLLTGCESYEAAFTALGPQLRNNIANENYADEVEAAVVRIEALNDQDRQYVHGAAAPGAAALHQEHAEMGEGLDENYAAANGEFYMDMNAAALDDEEFAGHANVGELVGDLMLDLEDSSRAAGCGRMSPSQFQRHRDALSAEQRAIFREVQEHIRTSQNANVTRRPPPLHLFVTGGAGVGKSFLIEALHELIIRGHMGVARKPVKLTAPTGVAAFNIMGTTLHTALSIPVEHCRRTGKSRVRYVKLNDQKLQALRAEWAGTRYLIIDEVSMVSYEVLSFVHRRLMEIMDNDLPFGGVSVICIGDFFQLPPVKANFVFHQEPGSPSYGHLWKDPNHGFQVRVLQQNQRQRGDTSWATHLNALRDCVDEDAVDRAVAALKSRLTVSAGGQIDDDSAEWRDAPRLFPKTSMVSAYNSERLRLLQRDGSTMHEVRAGHAVFQRNGRVQHVVPTTNQLPDNADDCGGLDAVIMLARGARIMLRRNIDTEDGLVNGAVGTITDLQWPAGHSEESRVAPTGVYVQFDNPRVGSHWRRAHGITHTAPVLILPSMASFEYRGRTWQRTQFPFTLAWAMTIHKVQGVSMERAVVDLGKDIFADGQAYVALSRVKSLEGLAITGLCEESIKMVSAAAIEEYSRLGVSRYTPSVVSQASQQATRHPLHACSDEDEGGGPLPVRMDEDGLDGDGDVVMHEADEFPPTPPGSRIPMNFVRSPHSSPSMPHEGMPWAATAAALLSTPWGKRRRRMNTISTPERRGESQIQGSGGEGEGNGGDMPAGYQSSQSSPVRRFPLQSPRR